MKHHRKGPGISWSYEFYPASPIVECSEFESPVSDSGPRLPGGDRVLPRCQVRDDGCNTGHFGMAALAWKYSLSICAAVPSPQNLADNNRSGPCYVCVL